MKRFGAFSGQGRGLHERGMAFDRTGFDNEQRIKLLDRLTDGGNWQPGDLWNGFFRNVAGLSDEDFEALQIVFGKLEQSVDLVWDNANKRLGVGIASPEAGVHINVPGFNRQLRIRRDDATGGGLTWGFSPGTDHTDFSAKNCLSLIQSLTNLFSFTEDGDFTASGVGYFVGDVRSEGDVRAEQDLIADRAVEAASISLAKGERIITVTGTPGTRVEVDLREQSLVVIDDPLTSSDTVYIRALNADKREMTLLNFVNADIDIQDEDDLAPGWFSASGKYMLYLDKITWVKL